MISIRKDRPFGFGSSPTREDPNIANFREDMNISSDDEDNTDIQTIEATTTKRLTAQQLINKNKDLEDEILKHQSQLQSLSYDIYCY